ncbi:MAG: S8 family serine peptidase [Chitinispirillaceae bacterium]
MPVRNAYIEEVKRRGGKLRHVFPWENAASFSVHSSCLREIASLSFVDYVGPVGVYLKKRPEPALAKKRAEDLYGKSDDHLRMSNIPAAHEYLRAKNMGEPGEGVLLGFFDCGFRFDHKVYSSVNENGQILAVRDFVDGDESVHDPDSVISDVYHDYYQNDEHGTQTLALVAGNDPGTYMGVAWGARFVLARTEISPVELRIEEDNWAAALVWADSLGVDIVSSSLGYRDGFTDPQEDYTYEDMDGITTVVSRAAAQAVKRGMIVVNSMGNEGADSSGTLTAPADVEGVVSVGAVDWLEDIAWFSSTGPTFDGRMKPDLVAMGANVPVPDVYSSDRASYIYKNGTSLSAPIVSGICALVYQTSKDKSPDQIRRKLFNSCRFAKHQTQIDNRYGRGIPDALIACMEESDIYLKLVDSSGAPLPHAVVRLGRRSFSTNESGVCVIDAGASSLPLVIDIDFRSMAQKSVTVDTLPYAQDIVLDVISPEKPYFCLYPTVLKKNSTLNCELIPEFSAAGDFSALQASVRTVDGNIVWTHSQYPARDGITRFSWDVRNRGRRVVPGLYFFTVRYGGRITSRKFMVVE